MLLLCRPGVPVPSVGRKQRSNGRYFNRLRIEYMEFLSFFMLIWLQGSNWVSFGTGSRPKKEKAKLAFANQKSKVESETLLLFILTRKWIMLNPKAVFLISVFFLLLVCSYLLFFFSKKVIKKDLSQRSQDRTSAVDREFCEEFYSGSQWSEKEDTLFSFFQNK